MKVVGNGRHISFWFDKWCDMGVMIEILGDRGIIDMGIRIEATVEEVLLNPRMRKRHRRAVLSDIERELEKLMVTHDPNVRDQDLWRSPLGYKPNFSTQHTWQLIRESGTICTWGKSTWFPQATPKYAFIAWLATRNRLATMDRVASWGQVVDTTCVLCKSAQETRNHLFFECFVSSQIWKQLTQGILQSAFATTWEALLRLTTVPSMRKHKKFCLRYVFQATIYIMWRERNKRRHGEASLPPNVLLKIIDKSIWNKLSIVQTMGVKGLEGVLQYWFGTKL